MPAKVYLIAWIATLVFFLVPAAAEAQSGKEAIQELVRLFTQWNGDEVDAGLSSKAAQHIDYAGMAAAALGGNHWEKLTASQKREFVTTFRKLVERRYYPRWHKLFRRGHLNYGSETASNGDVLVRTQLQVGRKTDRVVWRMRPAGAELKVVNLTVGEKDLVGRLSARFQRHMAKGGFHGMMAWLKDKLDEDEDDQAAGNTPTASR
jgi:ABC-type transporter MlaC component